MKVNKDWKRERRLVGVEREGWPVKKLRLEVILRGAKTASSCSSALEGMMDVM